MTKRKVGLHTRLRPGAEAAYAELHREVPAEVLAAIRAAGVTDWTIFRDGLDLFHFIVCDDYDAAIAALAPNPANQRWQARVAPYAEVAHDYSGEARDRMTTVFDLSW